MAGHRKPTSPKVCEFCGQTFESNGRYCFTQWGTLRFCSVLCSNRASAAQKRAASPIQPGVVIRDAEAFLSGLTPDGECLRYHGQSTDPDWYQTVSARIAVDSGRPTRAHRVAYHIHYGPVPDGMFVLHRCDHPWCANPAHLFVGTQKDNMADAKRKGRVYRPPRVAFCKHGHSMADAYVYPYGRACRGCALDGARRRGRVAT